MRLLFLKFRDEVPKEKRFEYICNLTNSFKEARETDMDTVVMCNSDVEEIKYENVTDLEGLTIYRVGRK